MPELVVAVPKFHRPTAAFLDRKSDRFFVARRVEFLDLINVAAEAVEKIKAIILHLSRSPATPEIADRAARRD